MKTVVFAWCLSFSLVLYACSAPAPTATLPALTETDSPQALPSDTKTPRPTATRAATLTSTATKELLELEILDSDVRQDSFGNTRVTVTVRNTYNFMVEAAVRPRATLYDAQGNVLRSQELLEDGVYGTITFGPGETHTLYGCFDPCDGGVPVGDWKTYGFSFVLKRAE
jgi:hypothetical protein